MFDFHGKNIYQNSEILIDSVILAVFSGNTFRSQVQNN